MTAAAPSGLITGSNAANSIQVNAGGTLLLAGSGATNRIANTTGTTLNGGTMSIASGSQEGVAATKTAGNVTGTSATGLGALTLTASSTLDFSSLGNSTLLVFSSFAPGTFTLNITNWTNANYDGLLNSGLSTDDRLVFASSQSTNLNNFDFGFGAGVNVTQIQLDGGFYEVGTSLTPVPEPSTWLAGALALGAVAWTQRRRFQGKIAFAKVA
ncbi:MAG: PEP-CTERM sorting domain-containing protein [Chthoniobacterales bacterium]